MRVLFLFLCVGVTLFAHKLNIFAQFENSNLYVSAYYANAKGCQACMLKIYEDKHLIKEVSLNEKGEYQAIFENEKLTLKVDAGSGHEKSLLIINEKSQSTIAQSDEVEKLKAQNQALKAQVKALEEKLDQMNIFKTLLGLSLLIGIFWLIKRLKSK